MSFFNQKKPYEFISEMPANDEYDDEEYYGEEEGEYAEDEEYEEDYEEEEASPAPKKNMVKTAIFGVIGVAALGLGGFYAMNFFAPEMTQELVSNLPFVSQGSETPAEGEQFTDVPGGASTPAADGQVAPPPDDVTASADVAAVPPAPSKPQPVKPAAKPKPEKPAAKPKPAPKKPAAKPVQMAVQPAAKPKPAASTWKPKASTWKPKAASTWKPRYNSRYARYYTPKARYSRWAAARAAQARAYQARYAARYSRYAAYNRYAPRYSAARTRYTAPRSYGGRYAVQVGSFSNHANAQALVGQLRAQGVNAYVSGGGYQAGAGHLVRSVGVRSRANANRLLAQYRAAGYPARIVPLGNGLMAVSAGVYSSPARAQQIVAHLNQRGLYATHGYTASGPRTGGPARVYIGSYGSRAQAAAKMRQLQQQGIPAAVTTR